MKKNLWFGLVTIAVLSGVILAACSPAAPAAPAAAEEKPAAEAPAAEAPKKTEIALIIKATDSGFWQQAMEGGKAFAADHPNVNVTDYGPASEADVDEQLSILENVITSGPDVIVIASNAGEGAVAPLKEAGEKGIIVMVIDTKIPSDDVTTFLATDNVLGGSLAAQAMVDELNKAGIPLEGKIAIVAAVAGVPAIIDRDGGFMDKMAELAPNIEVFEPVYVNNEIEKALSETEQIITREGDALIGIYADNNHTGDGVGRAIKQAGLKDSVIVVAYDDDQEELDLLAEGVIKTLIIQDPHNMAYAGMEYALKALAGEEVPSFVDTGVIVKKAE